MKPYLISLLMLAFFLPITCAADETDAIREAWSKVYLDAAGEIQLSTTAKGDSIMLHTKPLLRWYNPVREGETHGDFFVWLRDGKPVVVGTLFSYILPLGGETRVVAFGLHPLVKEPIRFQFRSITGVLSGENLKQFEVPFESASDQPTSRSARLIQMRTLARSFQAWTLKDEVSQPLRLLTQPLLSHGGEYEKPLGEVATKSNTKIADAASEQSMLFAMVTGTDPELLLLLTHRKVDGQLQNQVVVTPARFSDLPLKLSTGNRDVWEWTTASEQGPYVSRHGIFSKPLEPR